MSHDPWETMHSLDALVTKFFVSRDTWETIHSLVPLATRFFVSHDTWETMCWLAPISLGDEIFREPRRSGKTDFTILLVEEVLCELQHLG